jgi:hypothetical protein
VVAPIQDRAEDEGEAVAHPPTRGDRLPVPILAADARAAARKDTKQARKDGTDKVPAVGEPGWRKVHPKAGQPLNVVVEGVAYPLVPLLPSLGDEPHL